MRILHVVTSLAPEWGGPARAVASLTEELATSGIECRIVTTDLPGGGPILRPIGVDVDVFPTTPLAALWRGHSPSLTQHLMHALLWADLVHIHEPWNYPHFAAWRSALRWHRPYIVTPHGALEPTALGFKALRKHAYFRMVQRRILEEASVVHAITDTEAQHLRAIGLSRPVVVIPNGVRLEEFDSLPDPGEFTRRYPVLQGKIVVLFMGRLHPIKGLDLLAEAFASIVRSRNDICLVVAGPDEMGTRRRLEQRLALEVRRGLVVFTGMLDGVSRLGAFSRADIFVLPARSEVRGLVALEAMACRLPVVVTDRCGFSEVTSAEAGIIVPLDVNDLVAALVRLADDSKLRETYGRNGRHLVESRYTWRVVAAQISSCYRSMLS